MDVFKKWYWDALFKKLLYFSFAFYVIIIALYVFLESSFFTVPPEWISGVAWNPPFNNYLVIIGVSIVLYVLSIAAFIKGFQHVLIHSEHPFDDMKERLNLGQKRTSRYQKVVFRPTSKHVGNRFLNGSFISIGAVLNVVSFMMITLTFKATLLDTMTTTSNDTLHQQSMTILILILAAAALMLMLEFSCFVFLFRITENGYGVDTLAAFSYAPVFGHLAMMFMVLGILVTLKSDLDLITLMAAIIAILFPSLLESGGGMIYLIIIGGIFILTIVVSVGLTHALVKDPFGKKEKDFSNEKEWYAAVVGSYK